MIHHTFLTACGLEQTFNTSRRSFEVLPKCSSNVFEINSLYGNYQLSNHRPQFISGVTKSDECAQTGITSIEHCSRALIVQSLPVAIIPRKNDSCPLWTNASSRKIRPSRYLVDGLAPCGGSGEPKSMQEESGIVGTQKGTGMQEILVSATHCLVSSRNKIMWSKQNKNNRSEARKC